MQNPSTFLISPSAVAVPNPRTFTELSPRVDYAISQNNTLTMRYQYERNNQLDDGISEFTLPATQGYNSRQSEHTVQISDDQVFNTKIVNEIRFQFLRENNTQTPLTLLPSVTISPHLSLAEETSRAAITIPKITMNSTTTFPWPLGKTP